MYLGIDGQSSGRGKKLAFQYWLQYQSQLLSILCLEDLKILFLNPAKGDLPNRY
jgi:hypothetical protein